MVKKLPTTTLSAKDITPAKAEDWKCPLCGTPYGKRRRCFKCVPNPGRPRLVTPSTARNGHVKDRLPSVERLNLTGVLAPRAGGVVSSVRAELRAMGEVLSLVEKLDDAAAERVVGWVLERIRERRASG